MGQDAAVSRCPTPGHETRPVRASGLCGTCYQRQYRKGGARKAGELGEQVVVRMSADLRAGIARCLRGETEVEWIREAIRQRMAAARRMAR